MPLVAKRKLRQTWREALVARVGAGSPVVQRFEEMRRAGRDDGDAAYRALAEAGRLWLVDEPGVVVASASSPSDDVPAV